MGKGMKIKTLFIEDLLEDFIAIEKGEKKQVVVIDCYEFYLYIGRLYKGIYRGKNSVAKEELLQFLKRNEHYLSVENQHEKMVVIRD